MRRTFKIDADESAPLAPQASSTPTVVTVQETLRGGLHLLETLFNAAAPPWLGSAVAGTQQSPSPGAGAPPPPTPAGAPADAVTLHLVRTSEQGPVITCDAGKTHKHLGSPTTRGVLTVYVGGVKELAVQTLEPPGPDSAEAGSQLRIPAATYTVRRPKKGEVGHEHRLVVVGKALGTRTFLEIHEGNKGCESHGCPLVGMSKTEVGVGSSVEALNKVRELLPDGKSATLVIENRFTEDGNAASSTTR